MDKTIHKSALKRCRSKHLVAPDFRSVAASTSSTQSGWIPAIFFTQKDENPTAPVDIVYAINIAQSRRKCLLNCRVNLVWIVDMERGFYNANVVTDLKNTIHSDEF